MSAAGYMPRHPTLAVPSLQANSSLFFVHTVFTSRYERLCASDSTERPGSPCYSRRAPPLFSSRSVYKERVQRSKRQSVESEIGERAALGRLSLPVHLLPPPLPCSAAHRMFCPCAPLLRDKIGHPKVLFPWNTAASDMGHSSHLLSHPLLAAHRRTQ